MSLCTDPVPHDVFVWNETLLLSSSIVYTCMQLNRHFTEQLAINDKTTGNLRRLKYIHNITLIQA